MSDPPPESALERRLGERAAAPLELVDATGRTVGTATMLECHALPGRLHRAFSAYLFDGEGRLLVHRRAAGKALWGGYWTNSCCSHPAPGETPVDAATRRIREELGARVHSLAPRFEYVYRAEFEDRGVEHEFVHVFAGRAEAEDLDADPNEMDEVRWLAPNEVDALIGGTEPTTPWFELAWPRLRG